VAIRASGEFGLATWPLRPRHWPRRHRDRCATWQGSASVRTISPESSGARPRPCASGVATTSVNETVREKGQTAF
jgi:hypothetical protein